MQFQQMILALSEETQTVFVDAHFAQCVLVICITKTAAVLDILDKYFIVISVGWIA
jgi:hypothetical protein